jgi:hypothetical protein
VKEKGPSWRNEPEKKYSNESIMVNSSFRVVLVDDDDLCRHDDRTSYVVRASVSDSVSFQSRPKVINDQIMTSTNILYPIR